MTILENVITNYDKIDKDIIALVLDVSEDDFMDVGTQTADVLTSVLGKVPAA